MYLRHLVLIVPLDFLLIASSALLDGSVALAIIGAVLLAAIDLAFPAIRGCSRSLVRQTLRPGAVLGSAVALVTIASTTGGSVSSGGGLPNLELREVERPAVGGDEVLVRVRASGRPRSIRMSGTSLGGRPYVLRLREPAWAPSSPSWRRSTGARDRRRQHGQAQHAPLTLADEVIDDTQEDFTRSGVRYDLIFDVPGNRPFSAARRALEPDGRYVPIGHEAFGAAGRRVLGLFPHFFRLIFLSFFVRQLQLGRSNLPSKADAVGILRELLAAGAITAIVDSTYPLSEIREALGHMIEGEARGKVIITA